MEKQPEDLKAMSCGEDPHCSPPQAPDCAPIPAPGHATPHVLVSARRGFFENLTGKVFGKLTVLAPLEERSGSSVVWRCRCSCGQECNVSANYLKKGRQTSCIECSGKKKIPGTRTIDLTGLVFGELKVVSLSGRDKWGQAVWHCKCSCGRECDAPANALRLNRKVSCGKCRRTASRPVQSSAPVPSMPLSSQLTNQPDTPAPGCKSDIIEGNQTTQGQSPTPPPSIPPSIQPTNLPDTPAPDLRGGIEGSQMTQVQSTAPAPSTSPSTPPTNLADTPASGRKSDIEGAQTTPKQGETKAKRRPSAHPVKQKPELLSVTLDEILNTPVDEWRNKLAAQLFGTTSSSTVARTPPKNISLLHAPPRRPDLPAPPAPDRRSRIEDLTGKVFGDLTVMELLPSNRNGGAAWRCRCSCGNVCEVGAAHLRTGRRRACEECQPTQMQKRLGIARPSAKNQNAPITNQELSTHTDTNPSTAGSMDEETAANLLAKDTRLNAESGKEAEAIKIIPTSRTHKQRDLVSKVENSQEDALPRIQAEEEAILAQIVTKPAVSPNLIDLTGKVFGNLTVVELLPQRQGGNAVWHCRCTCGGECDVRADYLKSGWKGTCGICDGSAKVPGTRTNDITAQRFGFLVAVERHRTRKDGHAIWTCRCDCGNLCYVSADYLIKGKQTSCRLCSLPRTAKACLHWQERED